MITKISEVPIVAVPLFFPPIAYTPTLPAGNAQGLASLCAQAGVPCRASGAWCQRQVSWAEGEEMAIQATPGSMGQVHVVLPKKLPPRERARWLLVVMAYAVFDGVARESVRGVDWSRNITPRGRPKAPRAKTNAERQRAWRERNKQVA